MVYLYSTIKMMHGPINIRFPHISFRYFCELRCDYFTATNPENKWLLEIGRGWRVSNSYFCHIHSQVWQAAVLNGKCRFIVEILPNCMDLRKVLWNKNHICKLYSHHSKWCKLLPSHVMVIREIYNKTDLLALDK